MTFTGSGIHPAGGPVCFSFAGASGSQVEVIISGQGRSIRRVYPVTNGKVVFCGRFSELGDFLRVRVIDSAGNEARGRSIGV